MSRGFDQVQIRRIECLLLSVWLNRIRLQCKHPAVIDDFLKSFIFACIRFKNQ
jgi:hypothetical protein